MAQERAQKLISQAGLLSRRSAEEAISQGRVALNGVVFTHMGQLVDPASDQLTLDGNLVGKLNLQKTFLFYKPRGVVTTKSDELGRSTVMDFFKDEPGLNPVGRLDVDSEGLLLMTHDGELLLRLTHPRYGVKKLYSIELEGRFLNEDLAIRVQRLLDGIELTDGIGKFDAVEVIDPIPHLGKKFLVTVSEGRNRFIRRMFAAVDGTVSRLIRLQMGEYQLGDLKPGERREVFQPGSGSGQNQGDTRD